MKLPVIAGVIDRRILVNYRVDPDVLGRTLPAPFRPKLERGVGLAGISLIRLRGVRPRKNAPSRTEVGYSFVERPVIIQPPSSASRASIPRASARVLRRSRARL